MPPYLVATSHALGLCSFLLLATQVAGQGSIVGLPTSEVALVGRFARGPVDFPIKLGTAGFDSLFSSTAAAWPAEVQAHQFFANGGSSLYVVRIAETASLGDALAGDSSDLTGLYALEPISDLRLLIAPELSLLPAGAFAETFNRFRAFLVPRRIFLILDPPPALATASEAIDWVQTSVPIDSAFCAIYYPYLEVLIDGVPRTISPSGAMAAIYVKNDDANGIWKSPSGTSLPIQAQALHPALGSSDFDPLNTSHINVIRQFAGTGIVPFGARSLDRSNPDNRFLALVRTRSWIAASIERSLAFAAVEDNATPLWNQIRALVENFLHSLFQQGALVGTTPEEAYFVRCDATTTTAADIAAHQVKVLYGLALLRAAEFDITVVSAATYDPARPVPRPAIKVRGFNGDLMLAYPTLAGFNYLLEISLDLEPDVWGAGGPISAGDGAWRRPVIPMTADQAYYRLQITPAR